MIILPKGYTQHSSPMIEPSGRMTMKLKDTQGEIWTGIFYSPNGKDYEIDKIRG